MKHSERIERLRMEEVRQFFRHGFRPSRKGNPWRLWDGKSLTVFRDRDNEWRWCVADGNDLPVYSRHSYDTEAAAIEALAELLEVGIARPQAIDTNL